MVRTERNGGVDRLEPFGDLLFGQPHHQVETEVVEAGGSRFGHRGPRAIGRVQTREAPQLRLTK